MTDILQSLSRLALSRLCYGLVLGVFGLLLLFPNPAAATDAPYLDENEFLIMPYTSSGLEEFGYEYFDTAMGMALYSIEQDADYSVRFGMINDRTISITINKNPFRVVNPFPNVEVCIGEFDEFDIPGLKKNDIHEPVNCFGEDVKQAVSFNAVPTEVEFSFMVKQPITIFEFFIGEGAGGGGIAFGCSSTACFINSINHGATPSSVNTETNFNHQAAVVMTTAPSCTCTLDYRHQPTARYVNYEGSYPSIYSRSVSKLISGSALRVISTGGTYTNVLQCGGQDGTLNLRIEGEGSTSTITSLKSVTCNDVVNASIQQLSPSNNEILNNQTQYFKCNATDNTALRNISLYANFSGNYAYEGSEAYTGLTYTATATFNKNIPYGAYNWSCAAVDTAPNTAFTTNRTIFINSSCNYAGSGDWILFQYCNLINRVDIWPNILNITLTGRLNITETGILNATAVKAFHNGSWKLKSKGVMYID